MSLIDLKQTSDATLPSTDRAAIGNTVLGIIC